MGDSDQRAEAHENLLPNNDHTRLKKPIIIPSADYDLHPLDSLQSKTQTIKDQNLRNQKFQSTLQKTGFATTNEIAAAASTTIEIEQNNNNNTNKSIIQKPSYNEIRQQQSIPKSDSLKLSNNHQIDKQSFEYILRSGLAGGLAGISAKSLIAPLDRVKILFQTNNPHYKQYVGSFKGMFNAIKTIYSNDGILGLYQGHSATLLRIFPYAAIKFVCYEQIRTILIPNDDYETAGRRLLAGSLAGVTSVYFTYPLDLIRVRLAFETSHHSIHHGPGKLFHTLKLIYNEKPKIQYNTGGIKIQSNAFFTRLLYNSKLGNYFPWILPLSNFYRGFVPTILGMVPYAGVSFYSHDILHDFFRNKWLAPYTVLKDKSKSATRSDSSFDHRPPLTTWAQLLAGGGAGMLAQASAYPFEVIRRRMQVGGVTNKSGEFYGLSYTAKLIFKERGFKGFYVGLGIGFLKVVPMFACSFY
ncbi:hypothetical protein C6P40_003454, partial [Pichia californica]